jgi:hypothetical protein
MLDMPRELVRHLARLLAAQRRLLRTRRRTQALTCYHQALMVLAWFRKAEDTALLGAGFGVFRATAYRYIAEGIAVLAAQQPDLHDTLRRAAGDGSRRLREYDVVQVIRPVRELVAAISRQAWLCRSTRSGPVAARRRWRVRR